MQIGLMLYIGAHDDGEIINGAFGKPSADTTAFTRT
jgi:hypothetical protein